MPHDNVVFTGPTICHAAFLRALRYVRVAVFLFFFLNLGFTRACRRSFGITSYLPPPPIVFASSSIDKHSSQLSTAGIRQQTAAPPTSQQQHSKSTRVYHTWKLSPTRLHRVLRSRVNVYGKVWSQTDRLYRDNFIKS